MSSSKNFKYLDDLIHSGVKEVVLDSDIILDDEEVSKYLEGINLDVDDLVIDAQGHKIDAYGKTRIFYCTGKNIAIKNIVLTNAFTDINGGAILNEGNLNIFNVVFCDNIAEGQSSHYNTKIEGGAAIFNNGILKISDSRFNNNSTKNSGGAILNFNNLTVEFSVFENNLAMAGGGAILNNGNLEISDSTFLANSTEGSYIPDYRESIGGGALCNNGSSNIIKSVFENNKSKNHGAGILNLNNLSVGNCDFKDNEGALGGAISNESGSLDILNSNLKNNSAHAGGAIFNEGHSILYNSILSENTANYGGAVCSNNLAEIRNSILSTNHAKEYESGGAIENGGCLKIRDSDVLNNHTDYYCGAIFNKGQMLMQNIKLDDNGSLDISNKGDLIINKIICSNKSKAILNKGCIHTNDSIINMDNHGKINEIKLKDENQGDFSYLNNLIKNSGNEIRLEKDILFNISNDDEFSCFGGINIDKSNLVIDGAGHTVDAQGLTGIFTVKGRNIVLKNIILKNGFAMDGGAVYNHGKLDISDSIIIDCKVEFKGGAIFNEGDLDIYSSDISDNKSDSEGGAIFNKGTLNISNAKLKGNVSCQLNGGAIYNRSTDLNINDSILCDNAANYGGAIYNDEGNVLIENANLSNNLARSSILDDGGGAIANHRGNLAINSSFLSHNESNWNAKGGAIYNDENLSIEDSKLSHNSSKTWGGAIFNLGMLSIARSDFSNNYSGNEGGAIVSFNGKLAVVESKFCKNKGIRGGAIYYGSTEYESDNCAFKDNDPDDVCRYSD